MGILSFCLGIGSLESSVASLLPFVTGSHDISSFLDGKPCLTTCGMSSHGCYGNEKSLLLVHLSFPLHQTDCFKFIAFLISLFFFLSFFFSFFFFFFFVLAAADRPLLEERYQGRIKAGLEFAVTVDDFDDLVDPRCLYECYLGPEPSGYVLKKIA